MSKMTVIAKLTTQDGKRDELVAGFRDYFPQVEGEDGTLVYSISVDTADDNVAWVYELYTDGDALGAHSGSDAFKAFGKKLAGVLGGAPEIHVLNPVIAKGHEI